MDVPPGTSTLEFLVEQFWVITSTLGHTSTSLGHESAIVGTSLVTHDSERRDEERRGVIHGPTGNIVLTGSNVTSSETRSRGRDVVRGITVGSLGTRSGRDRGNKGNEGRDSNGGTHIDDD